LQVKFEIIDTGIGIEKHKVKDIFNVFGRREDDLVDNACKNGRKCKSAF
jgi:K+-sensing histidine kinase KdpD